MYVCASKIRLYCKTRFLFFIIFVRKVPRVAQLVWDMGVGVSVLPPCRKNNIFLRERGSEEGGRGKYNGFRSL